MLAAQAAQTVLFVGEHSPPFAVAEPAEQTVQLEQGERPLKLHVEPAMQFDTCWHESEGASQKKPEAQLQLVWPGKTPVAYSDVVGQLVQAASPADANVLAGHTAQTVLFVFVQGVDGAEPAAQMEQAAQGATPEAL